jgi:hypothetical protein
MKNISKNSSQKAIEKPTFQPISDKCEVIPLRASLIHRIVARRGSNIPWTIGLLIAVKS